MIAAILCPGPSLASLSNVSADIVLAVNRAATRFRADVWVACDYQLVRDERAAVIGTPVLFTNHAGAMWLQGGSPWLARVEEFEQLPAIGDLRLTDTSFSSVAALHYAAHAGATAIHCHGMDWSGTKDFDGWDKAGNRRESRWENERRIWTNMANALRAGGVSVERVIA